MKIVENIGKKVFSIISEGIIRETHNSIPQCYYVFGELGYGKTTLLHRIKEKFESQNFQPIYIDCLLHPIPNEEKMEEYLHSVTDHKRAILLIDEAHILLNTWSNQELSKLRALIYSPGAPIIVFVGNRVTKIFTEYSAPLYNSILLLTLDKLADTDIICIVDNICGSKCIKHEDIINIVNSLEPSPIIALPGPAAHCHHFTKGTDAMPIVENCQRYAVEKQRHHCSNKKTQGKKSGRSNKGAT